MRTEKHKIIRLRRTTAWLMAILLVFSDIPLSLLRSAFAATLYVDPETGVVLSSTGGEPLSLSNYTMLASGGLTASLTASAEYTGANLGAIDLLGTPGGTGTPAFTGTLRWYDMTNATPLRSSGTTNKTLTSVSRTGTVPTLLNIGITNNLLRIAQLTYPYTYTVRDNGTNSIYNEASATRYLVSNQTILDNIAAGAYASVPAEQADTVWNGILDTLGYVPPAVNTNLAINRGPESAGCAYLTQIETTTLTPASYEIVLTGGTQTVNSNTYIYRILPDSTRQLLASRTNSTTGAAVTLDLRTWNNNTAGFYRDLVASKYVFEVKNAAGYTISSQPARLIQDPVLNTMLDSGMIDSWADFKFYVCRPQLSVQPPVNSDTPLNTSLTLVTAPDYTANGYAYLWQRVRIAPDGTIPTSGYEDLAGLNGSPDFGAASTAPITATLDSVRYAYRALLFPDAQARTDYLNGLNPLSVWTNAVPLFNPNKLPLLGSALWDDDTAWTDIQTLLIDLSATLNATPAFYSGTSLGAIALQGVAGVTGTNVTPPYQSQLLRGSDVLSSKPANATIANVNISFSLLALNNAALTNLQRIRQVTGLYTYRVWDSANREATASRYLVEDPVILQNIADGMYDTIAPSDVNTVWNGILLQLGYIPPTTLNPVWSITPVTAGATAPEAAGCVYFNNIHLGTAGDYKFRVVGVGGQPTGSVTALYRLRPDGTVDLIKTGTNTGIIQEYNLRNYNGNGAGLFADMILAKYYYEVRDANGYTVSSEPRRLVADAVLNGMLDSGMIDSWDDFLFYVCAKATLSVQPPVISSTPLDAPLTLVTAPDHTAKGYSYLWQRVLINTADGSIPETGYENLPSLGSGYTAPLTATLDSIRYAYRALLFPDAQARADYLTGLETLHVWTNTVPLFDPAKLPLIYQLLGNPAIVWEDIQYLLGDTALLADVHTRSQSYPTRVDRALPIDTAEGPATISPDQMWVTLTSGIGGADSYVWQRRLAGSSDVWAAVGTTDVQDFSIHMNAATDDYEYRCIVTRAGLPQVISTSVTFSSLPGLRFGDPIYLNGPAYIGYLPDTGNRAADWNQIYQPGVNGTLGDLSATQDGAIWNVSSNREQYAFAPNQPANNQLYDGGDDAAQVSKWVPEEAGKEGDLNAQRTYQVNIRADFSLIREPDPVVYMITEDMDYATSDLIYARMWDPTIYNIATGTEIKRAINRFVQEVLTDGSGSFVGFSYTGHKALPNTNTLFAAPYFTNNPTAAADAFSTLHQYGICGNGHWDSGFSAISGLFSGINENVVETYLYGNDQNRIQSVKRVGISIAGSNENGYGGSKTIGNLFGTYVETRDFWYGLLTTDGSGNHWLKNSTTISGLTQGLTTEEAVYNSLMDIHNSTYKPYLTQVMLRDVIRAEFDVVAPAGASVTVSGGVRTSTWVDAAGDTYIVKVSVDGGGTPYGDTTVEIRLNDPADPYYYRQPQNQVANKTIDVIARADYIGSNDVYANRGLASISYVNQMGQPVTSYAPETPTVNVPIQSEITQSLNDFVLKGDAADLDALGQPFITRVRDIVYKYEQVNGDLELVWDLDGAEVARSTRVTVEDTVNPRPFPATDTTTSPLTVINQPTQYHGEINFYPSYTDPEGQGYVPVTYTLGDIANAQLLVTPITPLFNHADDRLWLGQPLNTLNPTGPWPVEGRFYPALPLIGAISGISTTRYNELAARVASLEYTSKLIYAPYNAAWIPDPAAFLQGTDIPGDLSPTGGSQVWRFGVTTETNGVPLTLYGPATGEAIGYPTYTVYQGAPNFTEHSYTIGLRSGVPFSVRLRDDTGDAGLVSLGTPTAPAWQAEKPAYWTDLLNAYSAYGPTLRVEYAPPITLPIGEPGEGTLAGETIALDPFDSNLLDILALRGHMESNPLTPAAYAYIGSSTVPFQLLRPAVYVVPATFSVTKQLTGIPEEWDTDWRFPVRVTGGSLPADGLDIILAAGETARIAELDSGETYTAQELTAWTDQAWTPVTASGSGTPTVQVRRLAGDPWVASAYGVDTSIAQINEPQRHAGVTILNTYTPGNNAVYSEDEVTNALIDGVWQLR